MFFSELVFAILQSFLPLALQILLSLFGIFGTNGTA